MAPIPIFTAKGGGDDAIDNLVVIFLLLVAGAATASPALAQPTAGSPSDVAADFNHDGFVDLAVRSLARTTSPGR